MPTNTIPIVAITIASTLDRLAKHLPVALRGTALVYVAQCIDCERRHTPAATQARAYSSAILADWHDGPVAGLLRCPACAVRYYQRDAATERRRYQDLFRSLTGLLAVSVDTEAQLETCVLQAVKASRFEPLAKEFERLYHTERRRAEQLHGVVEDVRSGRLLRCSSCKGRGDKCVLCHEEWPGLMWRPDVAREQDYAKALVISARDLATRTQERDAARAELQQLQERRRLALARGAERRQKHRKLSAERDQLRQMADDSHREATLAHDALTAAQNATMDARREGEARVALFVAERDAARSALDAIAEMLWPPRVPGFDHLIHRPDTATEEGRASIVRAVHQADTERENARANCRTADAETGVQRARAAKVERERDAMHNTLNTISETLDLNTDTTTTEGRERIAQEVLNTSVRLENLRDAVERQRRELQQAQEDRHTANELLTLATQENAQLRAKLDAAYVRDLRKSETTPDVVDAATEHMVDLTLQQAQAPDLTPSERRELDTVANDIAAHDAEAEEAAARAKWGLS